MMKHSVSQYITVICAAFILFLPDIVRAQDWDEVAYLSANPRRQDARNGTTVAISGEFAFSGAYAECFNELEEDSLFGAGAVYVYRRTKDGHWSGTQKITEPVRYKYDRFGWAIAVQGNVLAIGAPYNGYDTANSNYIYLSGCVYLFEYDNSGKWVYRSKIIAPNRTVGAVFGWAVDIDDSVMAITASDGYLMNNEGPFGVTYIYLKESNGDWKYDTSFTGSNIGRFDRFGEAIVLKGNKLLVSSADQEIQENGISFRNAGAAYYFEKDQQGKWKEVQKIVASEPDSLSRFSGAMDMSDSFCVIGSYNEKLISGTDTVPGSGAARLFRRSGDFWEETDVLRMESKNSFQYFGDDVAIRNNVVFIGARNIGTSFPQTGMGKVFRYELNTSSASWELKQEVLPKGDYPMAHFGGAIACDGQHLIIGASFSRYDSTGQNLIPYSGACYIFRPACDLDTTVDRNGVVLQVKEQEGATYQWLNCDSNYKEIHTAQLRAFGLNSKYSNVAVKISRGFCVDTSNCHRIVSSWSDINDQQKFEVYPNPAKDLLFVRLNRSYGTIYASIMDICGREISSGMYSNVSDFIMHTNNLQKGHYLLSIVVDEQVFYRRIMAE